MLTYRQPRTAAEKEAWRRALEDDIRRDDVLNTAHWHDNLWVCEGHEVTYDGPPRWKVSCACTEPKPCFHEALVAREAALYLTNTMVADFPTNVIPLTRRNMVRWTE